MSARPDPHPPVPVLVFTGFLGSGKTTLLNGLLRHPDFAGSAVIVNEFGETSLDHHLIEAGADDIIEIANGCLCCTVRGQLADSLHKVLERDPPRILIETTGLADPVPVIQAIISDPQLHGRAAFAGLVTVFDAIAGRDLAATYREAATQLALADHVIVSKLDRLDDQAAGLLEATAFLRTAAPLASVLARDAAVSAPLALIDGREGTPLVGAAAGLDKHGEHGHREHGHGDRGHGHDHSHGHVHDIDRHSDTIRAVTLKTVRPFDLEGIRMFLDLLASAHGRSILRLKGLVAIEASPGPLLVHAVRSSIEEPVFLDSWPDADRTTRIVVFVDGIDPDFVRRLFEGFAGMPQADTPDRAALSANPLAVPGFTGPS